MALSVIIPSLNAGKAIGALLASLKSQSMPPEEIIVVDSSSDDETASLAEANGASVIVIDRDEFDHGGARNLGAAQASGDFLVFMTQDAIPAGPDMLAALVKPLEGDPTIAASYGRQLPREGAGFFSASLRAFNYPAEPHVREFNDRARYGFRTAFLSNSLAAYRRESFNATGGFKEGIIFGEDTHLGARLLMDGYKIAYAPDAAVYHSHDYGIAGEFRRYFDVGVFHSTESFMIETFGRAEGEGMKFVKAQIGMLLREGRALRLPEFFLRNAARLAGYKLGLFHRRLPGGLCRAFSMNKRYWSRCAN